MMNFISKTIPNMPIGAVHTAGRLEDPQKLITDPIPSLLVQASRAVAEDKKEYNQIEWCCMVETYSTTRRRRRPEKVMCVQGIAVPRE